MIQELQGKIIEMKKQKGVTILAHSYQSQEIQEVADYVGDSFQLSCKAKGDKNDIIIMAGVHFMAETVKMLSPKKKVILANGDAGCPMAEQIGPGMVEDFKSDNPNYAVVAYINTTADLKAVCDVCVTSSSAVNIVKKMDAENILFIPDCNLGAWVQEKVPEKNIKLWKGGCPIHASVKPQELEECRAKYPGAKVLVHPECVQGVLSQADFIGSTAEILKYAKESDEKEFIIGTELSIYQHLSMACPDKKFYLMSKKLICSDMKLTTLRDIYDSIMGVGGLVIEMSDEKLDKAVKCINKMIQLGK